jgi:hypothetical protein
MSKITLAWVLCAYYNQCIEYGLALDIVVLVVPMTLVIDSFAILIVQMPTLFIAV